MNASQLLGPVASVSAEYPQLGVEPNVYYIPPAHAPGEYLTQMIGPGVPAAVETYENAKNDAERLEEIELLADALGLEEVATRADPEAAAADFDRLFGIDALCPPREGSYEAHRCRASWPRAERAQTPLYRAVGEAGLRLLSEELASRGIEPEPLRPRRALAVETDCLTCGAA